MSNQCSESFKGFDLSIFDHFCLHLDMPSISYYLFWVYPLCSVEQALAVF